MRIHVPEFQAWTVVPITRQSSGRLPNSQILQRTPKTSRKKKSVRTQKSRRELLIEDTRPTVRRRWKIDKKFEFNEIPVLVTEESVENASDRMDLPKR